MKKFTALLIISCLLMAGCSHLKAIRWDKACDTARTGCEQAKQEIYVTCAEIDSICRLIESQADSIKFLKQKLDGRR